MICLITDFPFFFLFTSAKVMFCFVCFVCIVCRMFQRLKDKFKWQLVESSASDKRKIEQILVKIQTLFKCFIVRKHFRTIPIYFCCNFAVFSVFKWKILCSMSGILYLLVCTLLQYIIKIITGWAPYVLCSWICWEDSVSMCYSTTFNYNKLSITFFPWIFLSVPPRCSCSCQPHCSSFIHNSTKTMIFFHSLDM